MFVHRKCFLSPIFCTVYIHEIIFDFGELESFQLKLAVVKVITSGIFAEAEILPLLIGAVALGPGEVEIAGDVAIKRINLDEVLNSKDVVKSLFNLYLGGSSQAIFLR